MRTYVVRVWLPDRPGALGSVASRIGAVRGDVIGIDILETGEGVAVDDLLIRIPHESPIDLLVAEIEEVDGVVVEAVEAVAEADHDRPDPLEAAAIVCGASTTDEVLDALVGHGVSTFGAVWAAVVDPATGTVRAAEGSAPTEAWLTAFVHGAGAGASDVAGGGDVAWAPLPQVGLAVVAGREGTPFRAKERRQIATLAGIAAVRAREVGLDRSRLLHPSALPSGALPVGCR